MAIDLPLRDEAATAALASDIAAMARPGDAIALAGGLGVGKTTFARAFLRAFCDDPVLEVPSPTFTLVQIYEEGRFPVAHFDLYRVETDSEPDELGLDDALDRGAVLVEWPERAPGRLPPERLDVTLTMEGAGRVARLEGGGDWPVRLARTLAVRDFLARQNYASAVRRHVKGDVSTRRYERIATDAGSRIVMDWPPMPPPEPGSYDARAARATDVATLVAVADAMRQADLSAPAILAADRDLGFALIEDLGTEGIAADGSPVPDRYGVCVDVLLRLHDPARPVHVDRPAYDAEVLRTELTLFVDHYLPWAGAPVGSDDPGRFAAAWSPLLAAVDDAPRTLVLRDVHSPNLLWLAGRTGLARVGLLDTQDALMGHPAYDLVSLLQDARVTVPEALETANLERYVAARQRADPGFDADAFRAAYAILGAQRAMKILGAFARLAGRGRSGYLVHIPRMREYLGRNLAHPVLSAVRRWYEDRMSGAATTQ